MKKFDVTLVFNCRFNTEVYANDEVEALEKARDLADDADMKEFVIFKEVECQASQLD